MLLGLFSKSGGNNKSTKQSLPGTKLYFHPQLVDDLLSDHEHLLNMFGKIDTAHKNGHAKLAIKTLHQFNELLISHLIAEHSKLYVYLRHTLPKASSEAVLIQNFQKEMRGISKVLNNFIDEFSYDEWSDEQSEAFGIQLADIGDVLIHRIGTEEETLFPLYNNPSFFEE